MIPKFRAETIARLLLLPLMLAAPACGKRDAVDNAPAPEPAASPPAPETLAAPTRMAARQEIASPLSDGWHSEALAEIAAGQLKSLAKGVVAGSGDPRVAKELLQAFSDLPSSFGDRHAEVHVFAVHVGEGGEVRTAASFEASATDGESVRAALARWEAEWNTGGDPEQPALELTALATRDVQLSGGRRWFTDKTAAVLAGDTIPREQLASGLDHWLARIERLHGMDAFIRNGLALGDADGDGRDDVYLPQPGGLPNRLLLHQGDNTVIEASAAAGVDYLDHTSSALFVDLDNDGDQDLALAIPAGLLLLENGGGAKFSERGVLRTGGSDVHALAAADYNLDGHLDLYLTFAMSDRLPGDDSPQFVYHDARDGGANNLFRNDGGWSFSEVTRAVGLDENNTRHSLAAGWRDFDLDGDPDLYVANDYGPNNLYRNDLLENGSRRFTDIAEAAGAADYGSGMSAAWGDYDRDGHPDLYVGNMFSNAGHRITAQAKFATGGDPELRALYRRFAKGNSLFRGSGGGGFEETGAAAGVEMGRWAWGSPFADLDNDGWEDLFVANGYISGDGAGDL